MHQICIMTACIHSISKLRLRRSSAPASTIAVLSGILDKLEATVSTFSKLHAVDGVHASSRLVWNAALSLLGQKLSKQLKRVFTTAAQALAAVASPLHSLRQGKHPQVLTEMFQVTAKLSPRCTCFWGLGQGSCQ